MGHARQTGKTEDLKSLLFGIWTAAALICSLISTKEHGMGCFLLGRFSNRLVVGYDWVPSEMGVL